MLDGASCYILWHLKFTGINNCTFSFVLPYFQSVSQLYHSVRSKSEGWLPRLLDTVFWDQKDLQRGHSGNGLGLLTSGALGCSLQGRHMDRQLLRACLCVFKYPYTLFELRAVWPSATNSVCVSTAVSVADGARVSTGHLYPSSSQTIPELNS